jgi:hypothetical protein
MSSKATVGVMSDDCGVDVVGSVVATVAEVPPPHPNSGAVLMQTPTATKNSRRVVLPSLILSILMFDREEAS